MVVCNGVCVGKLSRSKIGCTDVRFLFLRHWPVPRTQRCGLGFCYDGLHSDEVERQGVYCEVAASQWIAFLHVRNDFCKVNRALVHLSEATNRQKKKDEVNHL
jgi:hypothetical protein